MSIIVTKLPLHVDNVKCSFATTKKKKKLAIEKTNTKRKHSLHLDGSDAGHLVHLRADLLDARVGYCRMSTAANFVDLDNTRRLLHSGLRVDKELHPNGEVAEFATLNYALQPLER